MVGDNGILTQAQSAKLAHEKATIAEEIEYMMADYNIQMDDMDIDEFLRNKKNVTHEIDDYRTFMAAGSLKMTISKGGYDYYVVRDGDYYKATEMASSVDDSSGSGSDFALYKADNFNGNGNLDIDPANGTASQIYSHFTT